MKITILSLVTLSYLLTGCGGGGSSKTSSSQATIKTTKEPENRAKELKVEINNLRNENGGI